MSLPEHILSEISSTLEPLGFESYAFKIGWYNDKVQPVFRFPYPADTLAVLLVSTPAMFERAFKPFIQRQDCLSSLRDPIDECIDHHIGVLMQSLPGHEVEVFHDFDRHPNNRPKVLIQTASHVAGAAYYYQRSDLLQDPWPPSQKIHGVCVHPKYGGWFALRSVMIFKDISHESLKRRDPQDVLNTDKLKKEVLEKFNFHWQDWSFRDIIPVEARYSEEQKTYFETLPSKRKELLIQNENFTKDT